MFILYEITSILKNMVKCGLPIPKKIKRTIEKLLNNLTSETGGEKNE
jgi:phage-related holin